MRSFPRVLAVVLIGFSAIGVGWLYYIQLEEPTPKSVAEEAEEGAQLFVAGVHFVHTEQDGYVEIVVLRQMNEWQWFRHVIHLGQSLPEGGMDPSTSWAVGNRARFVERDGTIVLEHIYH